MVSGCVQRPKRLNVVCKSLTGSGFGNVNRTSREYIVNKLSLDETLMLTYAKADSVNRDVWPLKATQLVPIYVQRYGGKAVFAAVFTIDKLIYSIFQFHREVSIFTEGND